MSVGAIGAVGGIGYGYGALTGLNGAAPIDAASLGRITSVAGSTGSLEQLMSAINGSDLPESTRVSISDAAQSLFSLDGGQGDASLGELMQALIVALILQLLAPGPSQ